MAVRLDVSVLVGLIMQAFCFGIFQTLFMACIYVLVVGRTTDRINWLLLITAILMWILIVSNFALSWSRIMDAFIDLQPALRDDPDAITKYFLALRHWKEVARTGVYLALTAVADTLFIYRLYTVWGRKKYIVVFPILLLCASIASGIRVEIIFGTTSSGLFAQDLTGWITAFFSISLVQNIATTIMIVYRIWRVNMNSVRGPGTRPLWPVIAIILESGSLYSGTLLVLLATYAANSFAQYIAIDMLVPITGITFTMIIVRVGLGLGLSHHPSYARNVSATGPLSPTARLPLQKLNINVSRHITVDNGQDIEQAQSASETKVRDDGSETVGWVAEPVVM